MRGHFWVQIAKTLLERVIVVTIQYFRQHQPPTLIVWGKNDPIFPAEGAHPYKRDLKNLEFHLLDTGHFALEEDGDVIAKHIRNFLGKNVDTATRQVSAK